MSEVNTRYTFHYSQPNEYRFSLDSVFLAQKVAELLKSQSELKNKKFLDLCSGCGVIGLELAIYEDEVYYVDFMEVQEIYIEHFQKNAKELFDHKKNLNLHLMNYEKAMSEPAFKSRYDFILSNPPYFFQGEGLYSPSEFKNRCRFFMDSSFEVLIESILYMLNENGRAFVLIRDGKHHGRTLVEEVVEIVKNRASVRIVDNVRGTNVVEIAKTAVV